MDGFSQDDLAAAFAENRQRLSALTEKRLNPILLKRLSVEDVLSEAYANAAKRLPYFAQEVAEALAARFPDDVTIKASVEAIRKARERRAALPKRPRRINGYR